MDLKKKKKLWSRYLYCFCAWIALYWNTQGCSFEIECYDLLLLEKVLGLWKQISELLMGREILKNRCAEVLVICYLL